MNLSPFIQNLPKAELQLHIEGTLEPELMLELAARNNVPVPFNTPVEARASNRFSSLGEFLEIYYRSMRSSAPKRTSTTSPPPTWNERRTSPSGTPRFSSTPRPTRPGASTLPKSVAASAKLSTTGSSASE